MKNATAEEAEAEAEAEAEDGQAGRRRRRGRETRETRDVEEHAEKEHAEGEEDEAGNSDENQRKKKPNQVSQEVIDTLHPVEDTGFAVGRGMVSVHHDEDSEEVEDCDDFTTIKTKKQSKVDKAEERRQMEEDARREIRKEANRQRKLRVKQAKADAAAAAAGETSGAVAAEKAEEKEEGPKHAAISLSSLRRDVEHRKAEEVPARGSYEPDESSGARSSDMEGSNPAPSPTPPKRDWVPQLHPSAPSQPAAPILQQSGNFIGGTAPFGSPWPADPAPGPPQESSMFGGLFGFGVGSPFAVGAVSEQSPKPSKEISEIWERPAAPQPSRNQPPPFPAPKPTRMVGPHGPPPPYKPPALGMGRLLGSAIQAAQDSAGSQETRARGRGCGKAENDDNWRQQAAYPTWAPEEHQPEGEEEAPRAGRRGRRRGRRQEEEEEYDEDEWQQPEPAKGSSSKGKGKAKLDPPPPPPPEPWPATTGRKRGGKLKDKKDSDSDQDPPPPPPKSKGKGKAPESKGGKKGAKGGKAVDDYDEEPERPKGKGGKGEKGVAGKGKGKDKGKRSATPEPEPNGGKKGGSQWRVRGGK